MNKALNCFSSFLLVVIAVFLVSCSSSSSRLEIEKVTKPQKHETRPLSAAEHSHYMPPWQTWQGSDLGMYKLAEADVLASQGKLIDAVDIYRSLESGMSREQDKEEVFLRRVGTELKIGKSNDVLMSLADYAKLRGVEFDQLAPRLCLVAAYAYLHQDNIEQGLAWLRLSYKKFFLDQGKATLVKDELSRTVASLSGAELIQYKNAWLGEQFIIDIFEAEASRRAAGGTRQARFQFNWFDANTYSPDLQVATAAAQNVKSVEETSLAGSTSLEGSVSISNLGVLLPFSGPYGEHAQRVLKGIELALETYAPQTSFKVLRADTANVPEQAASEFEKLARQEHVGFVFGPMEVKGTEFVRQKAQLLHVPFLSFTKREGITGNNPYMFRLGITARSQAGELVNYAVKVKGLSKFVIIYAANESGRELMQAFRREVGANGGQVLSDYSYREGDEAQILPQIKELNPEGIFIADALENVRELIIQMRALSINGTLLGAALWNDLTAIRSLGYLIDGAVFVSPLYLPSMQPVVSEFRKRYNEKYGSEPEVLSAQAYDATALLLQALHEPGSGENVAAALKRSSGFHGVTGLLNVQESGEINRRMSVIEIKDGQTSEVMVAGETIGVQSNGAEQTQSGE
ncbi:MAG: penicillin-binding protein activator [Deltaproteobacteria bacterium]|nr:penicillin-binding protein activator [Deltaproteobacteria bacterium]